MSCSLATDATPLLLKVMNNYGTGGLDFSLLADVLAQPLKAKPGALAEGYRELVSWLDKQTSHWTPVGAANGNALEGGLTPSAD